MSTNPIRIPGAPRIATNLEVHVVYNMSHCDQFCRSRDGSLCYCSHADKVKERGTIFVPLTESIRYDKAGTVVLCTMPSRLDIGCYDEIPIAWVESATVCEHVRSKLPDPVWE